MRKPTPSDELYCWWRASVTGRQPPAIHDDEPQCGYYRTRMVKGGPWVPVEVYCDRTIGDDGYLLGPEVLRAILPNGEWISLKYLWTHLRPIPREQFDALVEMHRRDERMAATHAPIDLSLKPVRIR